ncbi:MAG TPA: LamG domain-containing protein [Phycisphaerae bacterium]|nr:LamG domain-containing protein [Phycisphaerae bacterium]
MHKVMVVAAILTLCSGVAITAVDDGLVAYYPFDEGSGAVARDKSGNGNDGKIIGGAKWGKGDWGSALDLDGADDYVDCGLGVDITAGGTVMIWARPNDKVQGGLANWVLDTTWEGARLLFTVDTYHGGANTLACMSDGKKLAGFGGFGSLPRHTWTHLAYTFDGKTIRVYRDGVLMKTHEQVVRPVTKGIPLWIGKSLGLGASFFSGMLDEVRIYNRVLSTKEILAYYKGQGDVRGKDMSIFNRVLGNAYAYRGPGKIMVLLNAKAMLPLPKGTVLTAELSAAGSKKVLLRGETVDIYPVGPSEVLLDTSTLAVGDYDILVSAIGPDGSRIGEVTKVSVNWPGRLEGFENIKVLNNFCWELLNEDNVKIPGNQVQRTFTLPYDRWVFVQSVAQVKNRGEIMVQVQGSPKKIKPTVHARKGETTLESMQFLKAGTHVLLLNQSGDAKLKHLVVRAIPELQHSYYGADPRIRPYGRYNWDFLKKDVLPNINVMVGGLDHYRRGDAFERLKEWTDMGRGWISYKPIPWNLGSGEAVFKYWTETAGMQNPLVNGIIIDEANGGDLEAYDYFREAVEMMMADPKFKGKPVHPYCDMLTARDRSTKFARTCLKSGGNFVWEQYFSEVPEEKKARRAMHTNMVSRMPKWEEVFPGCTRRMVIILCYMSEPTESSNRLPDVNFKTYMDMQMELLANHPAFFSLGGIAWYHCGYSDEENVRWAGRLFRHFAINGNTARMSTDPYRLTHLRNPDFADQTVGWEIQPAAAGSIQPKKFARYGRLQSRWPDAPYGDAFLWMKRNANKPNKFAQEIKDLTPGRLYSMKMITADYQNLINGKSEKKTNAISIKLDNVELDKAPDKSFQYPFPNASSHENFPNSKFYMNYHWRVFRAKGKTAKLTVTDWAGDTEPGGPVGQELMFNFIEIQPYIEESE